ncbi:MAG: glycoside hydrolase family 16 protein [Spirochaetota bacterium]
MNILNVKNRLQTVLFVLAMMMAMGGCMFLPPEDNSLVDMDGRTLVWSDEFNGTSDAPDSSKWTYDLGAGGWGNNEVQTYTNTRTNSFVSNGTLKIKAVKSGSSWTSARLKTQGLYSFKYGYIEARIKLPAGTGMWPAFWMLGNNIGTVGWPTCGEIDVMEYSPGVVGMYKVFGTVHYPDSNGAHLYTSLGELIDSSVVSAFHTYGVKWDSTSLTLYIDGKKVGTTYTKKADTPWPFDQHFFIILNVAMGGNLGGTIPADLTETTMEVDYVRVYQ